MVNFLNNAGAGGGDTLIIKVFGRKIIIGISENGYANKNKIR